MKHKMYCPYCGQLLENGCECKREVAIYEQEHIEELEYQQEQNGFYAFQDTMNMWRNEQ